MNKGLTLRTGQTHVNRWTDDLLHRIEEGQIDPSFVITHRVCSMTGRGCTRPSATSRTAASRSCSNPERWNSMAYRQNRRANGSAMALARGLGWFSIGLGLAEMLTPSMLTEQMGMEGKESLLRFYGAREMAAGIGILMSANPAPWIWGRVGGDALDLATLATGLDEHNPRKGNVAIALAAVAGVTALDWSVRGRLPAPSAVGSRCVTTATAGACRNRRKRCAARQAI